MANKWTTEYPTQSGYYWVCNYRYKHPTGSVFVPGATVVELDADLDISFIGGEELHNPDYIVSAEWFGPIQPPLEPSLCMVGGHPPDCQGHIHSPQENENG